MPPPSPPSTIEYLTLAAAILSPVPAALTTIWTLRRKERELIDIAITWNWANDAYGELDEIPFLYVHNRGEKPVAVVDIYYRAGPIRPRRLRGLAMDYDDPTDIHFPYEIEPGKSRRFKLASYRIVEALEKSSWWHRVAYLAGRQPVWVEVQTMANSRKRIGAAKVAPWKSRPEWLK